PHSIRFNHPVQEIIWVCQRDTQVVGGPAAGNHWFDFTGVPFNESGFGVTHDTAPFERATIFLNNHDRTIDHFADYYRHVQQWEKHSRLSPANRWVYCYSFGLRPENMLDTGSTNMSRLDAAVVRITYPSVASGRSWTGRTRFYGRSRNLAKNTIGMMGIKFAA
ncbi:MAG: major capsid protein, partial [Methylococcales bacterium]|nr:major capsid protein [Methylococcales bacterium]